MSGNRKAAAKPNGQLNRLEERVTAIEIQNAERFATIVSELQHLREGVSALLKSQDRHAIQHKSTELEVNTLKARVDVVEESYKSFHKKLWGLVVAIIGSIGAGVTALWNVLKF